MGAHRDRARWQAPPSPQPTRFSTAPARSRRAGSPAPIAAVAPRTRSIFSRFAYFCDLVRITGDSLATLDARLHQGLAALDLTTGLAPTSQVAICAVVLSRAFPEHPHRRGRPPAALASPPRSTVPFTAATPAEVAADAAAAVSALDAAAVAHGSRTTSACPARRPSSAFTPLQEDRRAQHGDERTCAPTENANRGRL